jgi:L-aminopeptidase/D-esterase-like protein
MTGEALSDGGITDVGGLLVGRLERDGARVVVVLVPDGTTGAVDQRGGPLGTRETNLLEPENLVQRVDGVCLAGGGAAGLAAADGVLRWLSEHNRGFPVGAHPHEVVPIVPAATVPPGGRPDAALGYAACEAAGELGSARFGAAGFGTASEVVDGLVVGALAVVHTPPHGRRGIIGVVAVDAALAKAECRRLAVAAQDGLVRAVRPAHTQLDGDTIFALATGARRLPAARGRAGDAARAIALDALCSASARVFEQAVADGRPSSRST